MKYGHNYINNENGQTIVEFAMIVLLILILLFGITEFGRAWFYSNALTNSVRSGARYAATLPNTTSMASKTRAYTFSQITSSIPKDGTFITFSAFNRSNAPVSDYRNMTSAGGAVKVTAYYDFNVLTGSIIPFFSGKRTITRQATMRYEHD